MFWTYFVNGLGCSFGIAIGVMALVVMFDTWKKFFDAEYRSSAKQHSDEMLSQLTQRTLAAEEMARILERIAKATETVCNR